MTDRNRMYEPNAISFSWSELPFKEYFELLFVKFYPEYEVWIKNQDFERDIAAGIVSRNLDNPIAVTIYFKYGSKIIPNPFQENVLDRVRHHLISGEKDLVINQPPEYN